MIIESEGIVLKKTEVYNNTRMITLLTKRYGKLSCGTTLAEKGRKRGAMAVQPFSYGTYQIFKNRNTCYVNSFEPQRNFYKIGEDIDKYACGSYALEFTDRLISEDKPVPEFFNLLIDYLSMLDKRPSDYMSLLVAYLIKILQKSGVEPNLSSCVECGKTCLEDDKKPGDFFFSIESGGIVCNNCKKTIIEPDTLIFHADFGIIEVVKYILNNPINAMEKLCIDKKIKKDIFKSIGKYCAYHLDIANIKSEALLK